MNRSWLNRLALALVAIGVIGAFAWALMPSPVEVEVATVVRGAFERSVDEDGKTRVRERYVVAAPVAGRLLRVEWKAGDRVEPGAVLAVLVPNVPALLDARTERELSERVGAAQADEARSAAAVERASVAHGQARSELARTTRLSEQGFASRQTVERAQQEVELRSKEVKVAQFEAHAASHQVALAKAALMRLRQDPGVSSDRRWNILAPVAGQVLRVLQESETVVAAGAPILEIGDPRQLEVVVDVLTADAIALQAGQAVGIERGGGAPPLAGKVRRIEPAAFTRVSALGVEEQRVNVLIDIVSPPESWTDLGDAFRVEVRIVVESVEAVTLPSGALFRNASGWAVFVEEGGRARLRAVQVGSRGAQRVRVTEGVKPGEAVIVYPGDAIAEGTRIRSRQRAR